MSCSTGCERETSAPISLWDVLEKSHFSWDVDLKRQADLELVAHIHYYLGSICVHRTS